MVLSTVTPDAVAANVAIYNQNAEVSGDNERKPDVAGERHATVDDADDDDDGSDGSCINKVYKELNAVGGKQAPDDDD